MSKFKIKDPVTGNIIIDEQMLIGRYITSLTVAWNDQTKKTITHPGFLSGKPFFQIHNQSSHYLNCHSSVFGNHSHFEISFSGDQATVQQVFAPGVSESWVDLKGDIIIYFGTY